MSDDPTARIVSALDRFREDLSQLRGQFDQPRPELQRRLDRLQTEYATLQHDIAFNLAERDRLTIAAQSAIDEPRALANQVTAMEGQVRLLMARVDTIDRRGNGHAKQD